MSGKYDDLAKIAAQKMGALPGADKTTLPNTPTAIKRFQKFHGLVPDGIVGPLTRAKMRRVNTTLDTSMSFSGPGR